MAERHIFIDYEKNSCCLQPSHLKDKFYFLSYPVFVCTNKISEEQTENVSPLTEISELIDAWDQKLYVDAGFDLFSDSIFDEVNSSSVIIKVLDEGRTISQSVADVKFIVAQSDYDLVRIDFVRRNEHQYLILEAAVHVNIFSTMLIIIWFLWHFPRIFANLRRMMKKKFAERRKSLRNRVHITVVVS